MLSSSGGLKKSISNCVVGFFYCVYILKKSFSVFENMRRTFGCAPLKKCAWCGITIECSLWHLRSVLKFELWTLKCYNIPLNCTRSIGERQRKEIKFWFFFFIYIYVTLYYHWLLGQSLHPFCSFQASLQVKVFWNSNHRVTFRKIIFCLNFF